VTVLGTAGLPQTCRYSDGMGDVLPILLGYTQLRDLSACHIAGDDRPCPNVGICMDQVWGYETALHKP
jgi:hypothetical protein